MRKTFLLPVFFYKACISPLLPHVCIYSPSCSTYMVESVKKHGIFKGTLLTIFRLFRCSKYFLGGYDPVPEVFSRKALTNPYRIFRRHFSKGDPEHKR